ncbi:hypothetical protein [Flavobacterium sp.]|uniref:hypothetical protein n=1 Tax=Flavobacterium sp. TaxID=239 RepID=UPI0025C06948|nr:hypothetical protein [Flavobacterium sp.]
MNKKILFVLGMMLFLNCNTSKSDEDNKFYFSFYNNKNVRTKAGMFIVERKKGTLLDSVFVYEKNKKVLSFQENLDKHGVYRYILNKKTLTHSLNDSLTLSVNYDLSFIPFINKETTLINKKTYMFNQKHYKIYHYSEVQSNHRSFDSYYLENVGFICYYNFDSDNYILCDSTNIESLKIKEVTNQLINDTTFFARYTVAKLFPKYYRKPNNKISL